VKWDDDFAWSLYPHDYWDLRDILIVVEKKEKNVSSSAGHEGVTTSPNFAKRLEKLPQRIVRLEDALKTKNFLILGDVIEEECLDMHHVMQTQVPPLFYWNDTTKEIMDAVAGWRKAGVPVYFTIDAGPNVHLICEGKDEERVVNEIKSVKSVKEIIVNRPSEGANLTNVHLF
jgi:diphosphomevalonate decarboxylase